MKAVIFAAGRGTRCYPLTDETPKPLLRAAGKSVIEHNLEQLLGLVDEARIVVGYRGDDIRAKLGAAYKGLSLTYVEQANPKGGTAEALELAAHDLEGKLVVLNGDDFYSKDDIAHACAHDRAILGTDVPDVSRFGVLTLDGDVIKDIVEKPPTPVPGTVSVGVYVVQSDVLPYLARVQPGKGGERWLPDALRAYVKDFEVKVARVQDYWLPTGYPEDLLKANKDLLDREVVETDVQSRFPFTHIIGPVEIGAGTVIKPYTVIEGPVRIGRDCVIGPAAYLRPYTTLGDRCHIGHASETKNVIFGDGSNAPHKNYIGDSVVGDGVNFGHGCGAMNTRIDKGHISVRMPDGTKRATGLRKLGVITGNNVQVAGLTALPPGMLIPPNTLVRVKDGKYVFEPLKA